MVGTDNPARARNRALRAGGASLNIGERQGLTLVLSSAQLQRLLCDRGCS
jgi:hypothetical protein